MDGQLWLLGLVLFLVLLNGFFVAAEFAIVKLRLTQAEELAGRYGMPGRVLRDVRGHLDAYLSACQLGITVASLGLGWIGEPVVARFLEPLINVIGLQSDGAVHAISFAVAFTLISYLHIVLGELAPKSIAIRRAEIISLWTATPLYLFHWIMYPFIWLLNGSALLLLRAMGFDLSQAGEEAHSAEELKQILVASHLHGELGKEEVDVLQRTLEFANLTVADLMQPASDMILLDLQNTPAQNLRVIDRYRFSRYPVCDGNIDVIAGIAHIKDLFAALRAGHDLSNLRPFLRKPLIIRDRTHAFRLFRLFREGHPHFAVVGDEVGNVIGFLTLENLHEAMVGHIQDEFRRAKDDWIGLRDGSLIGSGTLTVYSLEKLLGAEIRTGEAHTVGGLVMEKLGRLPVRGERVSFDAFEVLVSHVRGPTIAQIQVFPRPQSDLHRPKRRAG